MYTLRNYCNDSISLIILIYHNDEVFQYIECTSVFLISSYGAPLAQRASYLAQHSSLFEPDGTVNYDYMSLTALTLC